VCPGSVTLTTGSLPPGIQFNDEGVLWGNPTKVGSYSFTLEARPDGFHNYATIVHSYTIVVESYRSASSGSPMRVRLVLPKRSLTPGLTNRAVRQSTIHKTICVAGWTAKVRPPASFTNALKVKQMKQYGDKGTPRAYEEDHLIPLELGGAPRSAKNLWPEPHEQAKHSGPLEITLKRKVCAGRLTLAAARKQILVYKRTHG
jgi:hypothetical protein